MKQVLQYRTFAELVDAVRVDLRTLSLEGLIDEAELIKIALRCNAELGLKIKPDRQVMLELDDHRAKLPVDFRTLNFAVAFGSVSDSAPPRPLYHSGGMHDPINRRGIYRTDLVLEGGQQLITHNLNTTDVLVQVRYGHDLLGVDAEPAGANQVRLTSNAAGLAVQVLILSGEDSVQHTVYRTDLLLTEGYVYVDHNLHSRDLLVQLRIGDDILGLEFETVTDDKIRFTSDAAGLYAELLIISLDEPASVPAVTPPVLTLELDTGHCRVQTAALTRRYACPQRVDIIAKPRRADLCYMPPQGCRPEAWLDQNFIVSTIARGPLYVSYQGALEDDEGNLLVADHEFFNDYYEYALKQRILENLILNGEPETQKLQLIELRYRAARNQALSYKNTPDFATLRQVWLANRIAHHRKYYSII